MTKEHHTNSNMLQVQDKIYEHVMTNYLNTSALDKFRRAISPERFHHLAYKLWDLGLLITNIDLHNKYKYKVDELK